MGGHRAPNGGQRAPSKWSCVRIAACLEILFFFSLRLSRLKFRPCVMLQ